MRTDKSYEYPSERFAVQIGEAASDLSDNPIRNPDLSRDVFVEVQLTINRYSKIFLFSDVFQFVVANRVSVGVLGIFKFP